MSVFDDIKCGLNEAVEYEKGNLMANEKTFFVASIETFSVNEIKNIKTGDKASASGNATTDADVF